MEQNLEGAKNDINWARRKARGMCSKKMLWRRLPVLGFITNYTSAYLVSDVIAGVSVGLTFIPSSMASALLAGLPPQYGLYSSFMCYFVYAVFGSCSDVIIGPTVITAMLCKPFVDKFGSQVAITLCFYSGCIITALAVMNMGFLVDFISAPVLEGFLSAAAILAISGQIAPVLGLPSGGSDFVSYWVNIIRNIQHGIGEWDLVLGVSCIIALYTFQYAQRFSVVPTDKCNVSTMERFLRKFLKYLCLGRTAIVVVVSAGVVAALSVNGEPPVQVADEIEEGLPEFSLPPFEVIYENTTLSFGEALSELSTGLFTIPLIVVAETMAAAKAFSDGKTIDATQEMLAVGMSNVLGSFAQSIPVAASVTRTTINHNAGAQTPLGGILAGSVVLMALGLFSSALKFLPNATLAAVIICAVPPLIQVHNKTIMLWQSNRWDLMPLHVTFLCCLGFSLDWGIIIGILANLLLILYDAARPNIDVQTLEVCGHSVLVVRPDCGVTYAAAEHVKHRVTKSSAHFSSLVVVLDGTYVHALDTTAIKVFKSIIQESAARDHEVVLWKWRENLRRKFVAYDKRDPGCFHNDDTIEELILSLDESARWLGRRSDSNFTVMSSPETSIQDLYQTAVETIDQVQLP